MRERINELVDFATSQSPYQSANQGWVNDDVYLQWGEQDDSVSRKGSEVAKISISWSPIGQIISILFGVLILAATFVFAVVAFSGGRLEISLGQSLKAPPQDSMQQINPIENFTDNQTQLIQNSSPKNESALNSRTTSIDATQAKVLTATKKTPNTGVNMLGPKPH